MMPNAGAHAGWTNRQRQPLAIALFDVRPAFDRFVDGHVNQVQGAAARMRLVLAHRQTIAGDGIANVGIGWLAPPRVRRTEVRPRESRLIKRFQRRAIDERQRIASQRNQDRQPEGRRPYDPRLAGRQPGNNRVGQRIPDHQEGEAEHQRQRAPDQVPMALDQFGHFRPSTRHFRQFLR
jgi:hypothetical protein